MASIIRLLLVLHVFSPFSLIQAGHPLWEYSHHRNLLGMEIVPIAKRWLGVDRKYDQLWENHEIVYCYEDDKAESELQHLLIAAMELWYAAGLPREFRMRKVNKSERQRGDAILLIHYSDRRNFAFPAVAPIEIRREDDTPAAWFSPYSVESIAHELGHVWGLLHEHQNKYFWKPPIGEGQEDMFLFLCSALPGYEKMISELTYDQIHGPQGVCNDYGAADHFGFIAAMEYLPVIFATYPQKYFQFTDDLVDWDSIMIYGSPRGESPYFAKADGSRIVRRGIPSPKDVAGILQLYNFMPTFSESRLLIDRRHPLFDEFRMRNC